MAQEKYYLSNKLEAKFRTALAQMNSLQYTVCPTRDGYTTTVPETVVESARQMRFHAECLIDVLIDIKDEAESFIEALDNHLPIDGEMSLDEEEKNRIIHALIDGVITERDLKDDVWDQVRSEYVKQK